jgi:hypothetical protein
MILIGDGLPYGLFSSVLYGNGGVNILFFTIFYLDGKKLLLVRLYILYQVHFTVLSELTKSGRKQVTRIWLQVFRTI